MHFLNINELAYIGLVAVATYKEPLNGKFGQKSDMSITKNHFVKSNCKWNEVLAKKIRLPIHLPYKEAK